MSPASHKKEFLNHLQSNKNGYLAKHLSGFFKTAKGEYGYGDKFWGLKVPTQRSIVQQHYKNLTLADLSTLIKHPIHEVRLSSLIALVKKYESADLQAQIKILNLYLSKTKYINNWDLVDLSSPHICGHAWFYNPDLRKQMFELANSKNLWQERISIISNLYFIRHTRFDEILILCQKFLNHKHDLIHKACGWMLREVGKRNKNTLINFLEAHYKKMPRTALRYSLEKLSKAEKEKYMRREK
ncbi:MAG: DNA alkylation repair protein [Elusimicrobiota bacterium]|jgi:3-methyladenine DNA glycosylase AlkD|nr:DNA alkylation repair protein [Elusimicrobiota bacterium]